MPEPPVKFDLIAEFGPTDPKMQLFWLPALMHAARDKNMCLAFESDSGIPIPFPARSPIDRMVDEACGVDETIGRAFARWFNANVWGEVDGRACNGDEPKAVGGEGAGDE